VTLRPSLRIFSSSSFQACLNCCVGQHELLDAIAYSKDVLHLPLDFELEHLPFRLINSTILPEDGPIVGRQEFLLKHIGEEKLTKLKAAISKWAVEKNVPMCVDKALRHSVRPVC
jgi:hypothetical protein